MCILVEIITYTFFLSFPSDGVLCILSARLLELCQEAAAKKAAANRRKSMAPAAFEEEEDELAPVCTQKFTPIWGPVFL